MYGTMFRLQPKAGQETQVKSLLEEWNRSRGSEVKGAKATYLLQSERRPGELIGMAVFDDKETYRSNASAPEQDDWYRRFRAALETDPIWEDGSFLVATQLQDGGSR